MTTEESEQSLASGGGPTSAGPNQHRSQFILFATAVQGVAAMFQVPEPLRLVIFILALASTTIWVLHNNPRPPVWFTGGILGAVALFIFMEPAGKAWLGALANSVAQSPQRENSTDLARGDAKFGERFVVVSVFEDLDGDGRQSDNEYPLPGTPVEIRDGEVSGMTKVLRNPTGSTGPQEVTTRGSIIISVCGISQAHEIPKEYNSVSRPMTIPVGLNEQAKVTCAGTVKRDQ